MLVRNPPQTKPYEDSCEIACKTDLFVPLLGLPPQCLACVRAGAFKSGDMGIFLPVLHPSSERGSRVRQGDPRIPRAQPTRPGHAAQIRNLSGNGTACTRRSFSSVLFHVLDFMAFHSITGFDGEVLHIVQR